LPLYRLETAVEVVPPAVIHQVTVLTAPSQVYPQTGAYERKVEPAPVIGEHCIRTLESFEEIIPGHLFANQLNQSAAATINKVDAYHSYLVIKPG
jgi:hypothetical protein